MSHITRRTAMIVAVVIAVAGITVSNLLPGSSGSASGSGSSIASKIAFSIGALSALTLLVLVAIAAWSRVVRRRNSVGLGA